MPWQPTEEQLDELKAIRSISKDDYTEKLLQMEIRFWRELARELRDAFRARELTLGDGLDDREAAAMNRADEALR